MQGVSNKDLPAQKKKAVFLDRDGVVNVERSYIVHPDDMELYSFTAPAIQKINRSEYLSIVVSNQSAVARNMCTEEDVKTVHERMELLLKKGNARLDRIYYCPHYPVGDIGTVTSGYAIDCDCRKPKTGMFARAINEFDIDASLSFMIGDSGRDIVAGKNAGCMTIGVRTGHGVKNTEVIPDYMFENLSEAVNFIIDDPLKAVYEKVLNAYKDHTNTNPFIIFIDGNKQSGKSTLASYLRLAFLRIHLKTQIETISGFINNGTRLKNADKVDIVIIERTSDTDSETIGGMAHLIIFTKASFSVFNERIKKHLLWLGVDDKKEPEKIIELQTIDFQKTEKRSKFANIIVNTDNM